MKYIRKFLCNIGMHGSSGHYVWSDLKNITRTETCAYCGLVQEYNMGGALIKEDFPD